MPRPRKRRKVCSLPESSQFGPLDLPVREQHFVLMTVDEYETIRLIDLEGMTQEECAAQMHVARTTVQGIYNDARRKLAESLVNGKLLRIQGGDYKLCEENEQNCGSGGCRRRRCGRGLMEDSNNECPYKQQRSNSEEAISICKMNGKNCSFQIDGINEGD